VALCAIEKTKLNAVLEWLEKQAGQAEARDAAAHRFKFWVPLSFEPTRADCQLCSGHPLAIGFYYLTPLS